jgi:hypothetical protein
VRVSLDYQKKIVASWFERRNRQAEAPFDPFIYTWIALNAALSARYGRCPDKHKVDRFAEELSQQWSDWLRSDEDLRQVAGDLADRSPIYEEPPTEDGHRVHVDVRADDAKSVMDGIYMVRNNLFQGLRSSRRPRRRAGQERNSAP